MAREGRVGEDRGEKREVVEGRENGNVQK